MGSPWVVRKCVAKTEWVPGTRSVALSPDGSMAKSAARAQASLAPEPPPYSDDDRRRKSADSPN